MSSKHKLRRFRALLSQQAMFLHAPEIPALEESLRRDEPTPWASSWSEFRAEYGEADASNPRRMMVGATAVLPIVGLIVQKPSWMTRFGYATSTEEVEAEFKTCLGDTRVKEIVFYADSPGGTAIGNEELWQAIRAAAGQKKISGYVRGLCASACFYLLSACPRIAASPSSVVGSIGVIQVSVEYSKMLAEEGITPTVITHGANKGAGNPYQPLTPAAKATLQKTVDDFGAMFVAAVARGRGVSPERVMSQFGQGQMFLAPEAQERGLIDAVQNWDAFLGQLKSDSSASTPESRRIISLPLVAVSQTNLDSSYVAGASATVSQSVPAGTKEAPQVDKKIKAVLMARGLIDSIDASDELCRSLVNAWFGALGKESPKDDAGILKQLCQFSMQPPESPAAAAPAPAPAGGAAPNVQAAHDREIAEAKALAKKEGAAEEGQRREDLQARGQLLGMTAEEINAGIDSQEPAAKVVEGWLAALCIKQKPIEPPTSGAGARITQEGSQRFVADAVVGLQLRMGHTVPATQVNEGSQRLAQMPLSVMALQCLKMAGQRVEDEYNAELVAEQALKMDGAEKFGIRADSGAFNRPGSFPNLLSALANKILDDGILLSDPSYPEWAGRWAGDLPDFKPAPIVNKSQHDEMDEVLDAAAFKEFGLAEEVLSYLQLARFGNRFEWTPVMMANDDLNAFNEGMLGLAGAHENTLNRLCLRQLTGNVTLLDTYALFDDTNHGNDVTSGSTPAAAAPSSAQWKGMLNKYYAQRGVGSKGRVRGRLNLVLAPPQLELDLDQTFVATTVEIKSPTTDATINPYRGKVKVVLEADLQDSSAAKWYGMVKPTGTLNATVVYCYFRGWGKNGRRERWYDPKTKTWNVSLEGRFGAAAKQYRTIVRNAGA